MQWRCSGDVRAGLLASVGERSCLCTVSATLGGRWHQTASPRTGEGETGVRTSLLFKQADPPDARARDVRPRIGVGAQERAPATGRRVREWEKRVGLRERGEDVAPPNVGQCLERPLDVGQHIGEGEEGRDVLQHERAGRVLAQPFEGAIKES